MQSSESGEEGLPSILLGCTGAVQLLSIGDYISALRGLSTKSLGVVVSPTAAEMTSIATLQAVADEVITEVLPTRNHIALSRHYRQMIVVPATANFLTGAAHGFTRNSVELMVLAMPRPAIIVPAMNHIMWAKPATQRSVRLLEADGHVVIAPTETDAVYEAASKTLRPGLAAATPQEVAAAVRSAIQGQTHGT